MKYVRKSTQHYYELTTDRDMAGYDDWNLVSNIYFKEKFLDLIYLTKIRPDEVNLNNGRFIKYTDEVQEHTVQKTTESGIVETMGVVNTCLDYISKNVNNKWSLTVWVNDFTRSSVILDFSFADKDDAIAFRLAI